MPEELFVSSDKYPVYRGDYVKDLYGNYYRVISADTLQVASGKKREKILPDSQLELSDFSIIRRMITYGLLNSSLLLDADDVLTEGLLDYLEGVSLDAKDLLRKKLATVIEYDRRNYLGDCGRLIIYDTATNVTISSIPLDEWFEDFVAAFIDETSTPKNIAKKLADKIFESTKKHKDDIIEGEDNE